MVVKLLESEDLALLEEKINMFIIAKDKEMRDKLNDGQRVKLCDFKVDIKVAPTKMYKMTEINLTEFDFNYIAVIQY